GDAWHVERRPEGAVWRAGTGPADVTVTGPAGPLLLALTPRLPLEGAGLRVDGDAALVRHWLDHTAHVADYRGPPPRSLHAVSNAAHTIGENAASPVRSQASACSRCHALSAATGSAASCAASTATTARAKASMPATPATTSSPVSVGSVQRVAVTCSAPRAVKAATRPVGSA